MNTSARNMLADIVRNPYAWPGGYERLAVTEDGALLCSKCCRKEARRIMGDIRDGYNTGWLISGLCYEAVDVESARECDAELVTQCDHCGREFGELA